MSHRRNRRRHRPVPVAGSSSVPNSSLLVGLKEPSPPEPPASPDVKRGRWADEAAQILRLIARNDYKSAIYKAKKIYGLERSPETEAILVGAYEARIRDLMEKGAVPEAKSLTEMVCGRYPSSRKDFTELTRALAARGGKLEDLVRPLGDPGLLPETRAEIESTIKREVTDLSVLANCGALNSDHPLRRSAVLLAEAWAAVTSGPVEDSQIGLESVSRRSPLAPWKSLIRAIADFYRNEDDRCEKHLGMVEPGSAPARLVPSLRAMLTGKNHQTLRPDENALASRVCSNDGILKEVLHRLDGAFDGKDRSKILRTAEQAVRECRRTHPDMVEKLKQHISIRSFLAHVSAHQVIKAIGGQSLHDAYFFRLLARAMEAEGCLIQACAFWEEFRRHALHEGWFAGGGVEEATVFLYMADLLQGASKNILTEARDQFHELRKHLDSYYKNQPESVLAAAGGRNDNFLYPERMYRQAAECCPDVEIYRHWLDYVKKDKLDSPDEVAVAWHTAFPSDSRPLLHLMLSAEERNAVQKALKFLEEAEKIDGLNFEVRRARMRLWVASALRHAKHRKPRLLEKDLEEIARLPQAREGDRPAFLISLRYVNAVLQDRQEEIVRLSAEVGRLMGDELSGGLVLTSVAGTCGLTNLADLLEGPDPRSPAELARAVARACTLGDDVSVPFDIPRKYFNLLRDDLWGKDCPLDNSELLTLMQAGLRGGYCELAYLASQCGLKRGGRDTARFLFFRGRSLPEWTPYRKEGCFIAAVELARRNRDTDLIEQVLEALRKRGAKSSFEPLMDGRVKMSPEEVDKIIAREKAADEYPKNAGDDYFDADRCMCPTCCRKRGEPGPGGNDEGEDFLEEELGYLLDQLPPDLRNLPPNLLEAILKIGVQTGGRKPNERDFDRFLRNNPQLAEDLLELVMNEPFPEIGPGKKKGKRGFFW